MFSTGIKLNGLNLVSSPTYWAVHKDPALILKKKKKKKSRGETLQAIILKDWRILQETLVHFLSSCVGMAEGSLASVVHAERIL